MKFIIKKELGDAILQYLAQRPWVEVNELILGLQNLEELKNSPKAPSQSPSKPYKKTRQEKSEK